MQPVLESFRVFLREQPTPAQATGLLRKLFTLSFTLQIICALVVGSIMANFTLSRNTPVLFAQVMVAFSLLQLPLTLWFSRRLRSAETRQTYISATLMSGTILATPVWFLTLVFLVVAGYLYQVMLFLILGLYYALGLVLCGRWGPRIPQIALVPDQKPRG